MLLYMSEEFSPIREAKNKKNRPETIQFHFRFRKSSYHR